MAVRNILSSFAQSTSTRSWVMVCGALVANRKSLGVRAYQFRTVKSLGMR